MAGHGRKDARGRLSRGIPGGPFPTVQPLTIYVPPIYNVLR